MSGSINIVRIRFNYREGEEVESGSKGNEGQRFYVEESAFQKKEQPQSRLA